MAIDPALEEALNAAVAEHGQSKAVATRLVKWLEALSSGENGETVQNRFYENVRDALTVKEATDAD